MCPNNAFSRYLYIFFKWLEKKIIIIPNELPDEHECTIKQS